MRYTVPLSLTIEADSPAAARYLVETQLLYLALTVDPIMAYTLAPRPAITPTWSPDPRDFDEPHILPEDYPLPPTRQLTATERAVLRGMLP